MNTERQVTGRRIGIVGCGIIADTHVEAILSAVPNAEISVMDPQSGKAELLRQKYSLRASYTDLGRMLAEQHPFSIHVLSPPHCHVRHAKEGLAAGCHVLVEKPLCFDTAEAQQLYESARSSGLTICVDHSLWFQPTVLRMRQLLSERNPLHVLHVDSFYGLDAEEGAAGSLPPGHWKHNLPGGTLIDSLVHPVSLAVGLTGKPFDVAVNTVRGPAGEQMKVMWRSGDTLVSITVSQGCQPFRRVTQVTTSEITCLVDHSTEVLAVLDRGTGPRAFRKLVGNLSLGSQLGFGTVRTAWSFLRKRIQQNPGARALIGAYYRHLEGDGSNPISEAAVVDTTVVLQHVVGAIASPSGRVDLAKGDEIRMNATSPEAQRRRIFVSGASGFLGRNLCEQLAHAGQFNVIAQVRRGPNADKLVGAECVEKRYIDFDQLDAEGFAPLLQGVQDVVHCAHAAGAKTWAQYEKRNVDHSLALYEAAARAGCERFVHISSLAVYGVRSRGAQPLNEDAPANASRWGWDFYIRSKILAEQRLRERAGKGGPQLLILRPGILYSPSGERLLGKSVPTRNGRLFLCIGGGRNHLPFTRVDSVANIIVHALHMESFPTGVFNLSGDQSESVRDFISRRCKPLGIHCRFLHVPALPLRMGALILEALYSVAGQRQAPKLSRYIVNSATRNLVYDSRKAQMELGWNAMAAVATKD